MPDSSYTRRASLVRLGGFLATVAGVGGWKVAASAGGGPAGVASGEVTCVAAPE